KPDRAVLAHVPMRVVRDLPRMAVRVEEHAAVAAVEGLAGLAGDRRAGRAGALHERVHLGWGAEGPGERDAAEAGAERDLAVVRQRLAAPEPEDHPAGGEEHDVGRGVVGRAPTERLVERTGPREVRDAEGDEADALLHARILPHGLPRSTD